MKAMFQNAKNVMRRLRDCEQGAEGLEKLLIIAAVILPLLALLLIFRETISEWVGENWGEVQSDAEDYDPDSFVN